VTSPQRSPRLPTGTQVVLREDLPDADGSLVTRGATGVVTGDVPDGRYALRLVDGRAVIARREQVSLRRAHAAEVALAGAGPGQDPAELVRSHTVYAAVVGSRAFGLATDESDVDTRGVFLAPTAAFWGLVPPPTHVEGPEPEWFSWELARFCELALKANPNLIEVLYSPLVVACTPVGEELLARRQAFLSTLAYQTYNGYVLSQFTKLEADLRRDGAPRWKHVMHLLRLLISARELLRSGTPLVDVGAHRDRLLAVRAGQVPWPDVEAWRLALHRDLDADLDRSPLPAGPDVAAIDGWLRDVRARSAREASALDALAGNG
jgi:hypothetical protein